MFQKAALSAALLLCLLGKGQAAHLGDAGS